MITYLKRLFKFSGNKHTETKKNWTSLMLATFIGILEDILFWKKMWLSLSCILFINVLFFIFIHKQINILQFILGSCVTVLSIDAFEAWLRYKHRISCLKRLATHNTTELDSVASQIQCWLKRKWIEFLCLRETNHTKAFLLVNIMLSIIFMLGKYMSGYLLMYILCMSLCVLHKIAPAIVKMVKKIQQNAESDGELDGLIPEVSDVDIKLLSIEPELQQIGDDRQSLDYWKPEDISIEEASDSSDNSSSLVTNLSIEKVQSLERDVDISDSSDDEYIPLEQQKEQLKSTLEIVQPADTWSNTAYNAFFNFTGAVANMIHRPHEETKRKRVSSIDSSDGFEMIDKSDLN